MTNHNRQYNKRDRLNPHLVRYLHRMEKWGLAEIGRFFDVSRQRIHQITQMPIDPFSKGGTTAKNCPICNEAFSSGDARKYCSPKCADIAQQERLLQKSRWKIFNRDSFTCQYCGKNPTDDGVKLHVDHIKPKSKKGSERSSNLITACSDCNHEKYNTKIKKLREFQQRVHQVKNTK